MSNDVREHKQFIDVSKYGETIINFSYFPSSDRVSCQIKQINGNEIKVMDLSSVEILTLMSIYQKLKFRKEE